MYIFVLEPGGFARLEWFRGKIKKKFFIGCRRATKADVSPRDFRKTRLKVKGAVFFHFRVV